MGEVYRAVDTRLGREVAVKILPAHLAGHLEMKARFDREAKAISLLNHAHICTLYDIGEANVGGSEVQYLVMELVEGEPLATRLGRGALPLEQALRYGMQMAEALGLAHRRGIVHRDLKPGNIMLTKGGVKLLDFGLAKLVTSADLVSSPDALTMNPATAEGLVVGTLQYMPPEQLEGRAVDARTDIFSFGAVLYEMITGRRAFQASSQASLIAAILHEQPPPMSATVPVSPRELDRVIATCMAKDPEDRWQNARDVMLELRAIAESPAVVEGAKSTRRRPWAIVAILALLGMTVLAYWLGRSMATKISVAGRVDVSIDLPYPVKLLPNGFGAPFAISHDGSKVIWAARSEQGEAIYLRSVASPEVTKIVETENVHAMFFSPDGQSIGFFSVGKLMVMPLQAAATPIVLTEDGPGAGAVWLPDGTIVYAPFPGSPLWRVPSRGGTAVMMTRVDTANGEAGHSWPTALPDGKTILYTVEMEGKSWNDARIFAQSVDGGNKKTVITGGSCSYYTESGYLLYFRAGSVMAVRFDPGTLETKGEASALVPNVISQAGSGGAFYSAASDGTLLYAPGSEDFFATQVEVVNRKGDRRTLPLPPRTYIHPRLSHDQRRVALQVAGANDDIWIYHNDRDAMTRLTSSLENLFPEWSPDGTRFAVSTTTPNGKPTVNIVRIDGAQPPVILVKPERGAFACSWSGDDRIAIQEFGGPTGFDLYVVKSDGSDRRSFLQTPYDEAEAAFSPDSRWLAYAATESGSWEVYVKAANGTGEKIQVSTSGGRAPMWHRDGRELLYQTGNAIMSVGVESADPLRLAKPQKVFEGDLVPGEMSANYDVSADGNELFIITRKVDPRAGNSLQFVMNPLAGTVKVGGR